MFFSKLKTFNDTIKLLSHFNWFIGLGGYNCPCDESDRCFQLFMNIYLIFSVILFSALHYWGIQVVILAYQSGPNAKFPFRKMQITVLILYAIVLIFIPLLFWLKRKDVEKSLKQMQTLDGILTNIFGVRINHRSNFKHTLYGILIFVVLYTIMSSYCVNIIIWQHKQTIFNKICLTICCVYPQFVIFASDLNFCYFVRYLGKQFRNLNEVLLGKPHEVASIPDPEIERIFIVTNFKNYRKEVTQKYQKQFWFREIRKVHLNLCEVSHKLNDSFGLNNLISAGISFIETTIMLYSIYRNTIVNHESNGAKISSILWVISVAAKVFIVNHTCSEVSNEAAKTGRIIYEIIETKAGKELKSEIQEFAVQILQNSVHFSAAGFFNLGYPFIHGMVGSITSYLVILIQMNRNSLDYDPPFANHTRIRVID